jgi:hypothetical protein
MHHGLQGAPWRGWCCASVGSYLLIAHAIVRWWSFAWLVSGRFVRFVSTPEVLERVTTIESEILQIEYAITGQGGDNLGLRSVSIEFYAIACSVLLLNIRNMI